jgi:hypothetical protein
MLGTSITHATWRSGNLGRVAVNVPHEVDSGASGGGPTTADGVPVLR